MLWPKILSVVVSECVHGAWRAHRYQGASSGPLLTHYSSEKLDDWSPFALGHAGNKKEIGLAWMLIPMINKIYGFDSTLSIFIVSN